MLNGSLNPHMNTSANVSLDTTNHILTFGYIYSFGTGNGEANGHTIYIIGA